MNYLSTGAEVMTNRTRYIPVPFIRHQLGAGDAVRHVTRRVNIPHCGGCAERQRILNERYQFGPPRRTFWDTIFGRR